MRESLTQFFAQRLAGTETAKRGGGSTERTGDVHKVAWSRARAAERTERAPDHSRGQDEPISTSEVPADDDSPGGAHGVANAVRKVHEPLARGGRQLERYQDAAGRRRHRGEIAQRRRDSAVADLSQRKPFAAKVNCLEGRVGAHDHLFAAGN